MMGRLNHDQKTAFLRGFSTCHGCMFDLVHFPQSGMISLIVEMPEDRAIEVGTAGSEGAIGTTSRPRTTAPEKAKGSGHN
jgi:hypothetical protein